MQNRFRKFLCLLPLMCLSVVGFGQETLLGDNGLPTIHAPAPSFELLGNRAAGGAAPFPFFDDFSIDSVLPTADRWEVGVGEDRRPSVTVHKGRHLPSKGALTFDGASLEKKKYETDLQSGVADVVTSLEFDLSTFGPLDSLFLSFFYQRGGWGDAPESSDSLVLAFDTTGSGDFVRVWSATGSGVPDTGFTVVNLHVADPVYFHPNFRFRFYSYGSLNGELDVWHVDYIYFAANRGNNDLSFNDLSPTIQRSSPLGVYTAIPRDHYVSGGYIDNFQVEISNAGDDLSSGSITLQLSDPVGGNALTGSVSQNLALGQVQPFAQTIVSANPFTDQAANMNAYGSLEVAATTSLAGDSRPENNTLKREYRIDTVLAYDDGEPDAGYGMTAARTFVQAYRIPQPDTLSGVWIAFTPSLHYNPVNNQSTCMDGATFKLALYDTLFPDSPRVIQGTGMVIAYDSADQYYQRFTFINPQVVPTLFWLGIQQNDNKPIGVGFDKQALGAELYFQANNGEFQRSGLQGGIMIRPEFANIDPSMVGAVGLESPATPSALLYPQPANRGEELHLRIEGEFLREGSLRLLDLHGREVLRREHLTGREWSILVPENVASGLYVLDFSGKTTQGKQLRLQKRCLFR